MIARGFAQVLKSVRDWSMLERLSYHVGWIHRHPTYTPCNTDRLPSSATANMQVLISFQRHARIFYWSLYYPKNYDPSEIALREDPHPSLPRAATGLTLSTGCASIRRTWSPHWSSTGEQIFRMPQVPCPTIGWGLGAILGQSQKDHYFPGNIKPWWLSKGEDRILRSNINCASLLLCRGCWPIVLEDYQAKTYITFWEQNEACIPFWSGKFCVSSMRSTRGTGQNLGAGCPGISVILNIKQLL